MKERGITRFVISGDAFAERPEAPTVHLRKTGKEYIRGGMHCRPMRCAGAAFKTKPFQDWFWGWLLRLKRVDGNQYLHLPHGQKWKLSQHAQLDGSREFQNSTPFYSNLRKHGFMTGTS